MALTLMDAMRRKTDDYDAGVIETFILAADITKILPIETLGTVQKKKRRTNSIATIGFRSRGQIHGNVTGGDKDELSESVWSMGATIDIDKTEVRDKYAGNILAERTEEAIKGAAWTFNNYFINGDHGTDPLGFEGLIVRLALLSANQTAYGVSSSAELEARPGTATEAQGQTLIDKIDSARDLCDGGVAEVCVTTRRNIRAIKSALRRMGIDKPQSSLEPVTNPKDQRRSSAMPWNKPIWEYDGTRFFDMGLKADQSTAIVGSETVNSIACDPFYFFKIGDPYLHIIQQYGMDVSRMQLLEDQVTYRSVVDWPTGIAAFHPRFASKLSGVRAA